MRKPFHQSHRFLEILRREPGLRFLSGNIELQQHLLHLADFRGPFLDVPQDIQRIRRLNQIRQRDRLLHLVLLQMPQQMPTRRKSPRALAPLLLQLLHPVLPDIRDPRRDRLSHID